MIETFEAHLNAAQRETWCSLSSPFRIQSFLDAIPYSADPFNRCPLRVLQDNLANCFDGAIFAAAALRRLGHPPLLVNLFVEEETDDEHVVAIFKRDGFFGAVGKSNVVGLRFREPIHRSLRELTMTYFEYYFNIYGEKTLRSYSPPLNLEPFDRAGWMWRDEGLEPIIERLDRIRRIPLLTAQQVAELSPVDRRTFIATLMDADDAGLYRPAYPPPAGSTVYDDPSLSRG